MFDVGFGEMILLAAIALIAIGPKQLPEVARALGKLIGEFKKTMGDVTGVVATARDQTDQMLRKVTDEVTSAIATPPESKPKGSPLSDQVKREVDEAAGVIPPSLEPIAQPPHTPSPPPIVESPVADALPAGADPIAMQKVPEEKS